MKLNKFFILIVIGIFSISFVSSLGVTPARTTIDFEPGLQREITFEVINSEGKEMNIVLAGDGELAEYISVSSNNAMVLSTESSKEFSYSINLPSELEPGLHEAKIYVLETASSGSEAGTEVLATLGVVTQLHVHVPYPGKYANAKMVIYNANQGEDVKFVFPVVSAGEFDLTSVRANVDIYNKLNEKIDSFNTNIIEIPSGEKREIVYNWKADVPLGEYRAVAALIYDEGTINLEEVFSVGSKELELQDITVREFTLGEIAKLEMLVENKWSEPISGAYIETRILNDEGGLVSSFESASYDIDPLVKKVFNSFWDTAGVRIGTYETEISINYADKSSKKDLQFQVEENELRIIGLGYVISSRIGESNTSTIVVVLIGVVIVLVLVNLLWFFLLRKRLKK
jgi:hypothetical protein|tara:strand:- start:221 stop:1420 length:1200 start_codon:yes stop_codon:yes gene_type:complete